MAAALYQLANDLAVPLRLVLLTAHAKVLAALSGEREVSTRYVAAPGRRPLPCRLTTAPHSWRAMLRETDRAECRNCSRTRSPVSMRRGGIRPASAPAEPMFATVFNPAGEVGGEFGGEFGVGGEFD